MTHRRSRRPLTRIRLAALPLILIVAGCGSGLSKNDQVFIVAPDGGPVERLTHDEFVHDGIGWSADGTTLVTSGGDASHGYIHRVDASSGAVEELARFDSAAVPTVVPSPAGDLIAVARYLEGRRGRVEIFIARSGGSGRRLVRGFRSQRLDGFGPSWSGDGRWIAFAAGVRQGDSRADQLFVTRVEGIRPRRTSVGAQAGERIIDPHLSADGSRVLALVGSGLRPDFLRLVIADRRTGRVKVLAGGLITADADWAPDGRSIVLSGVTARGDRHYHLYRVDADGGPLVRLSDEHPSARRPRHSPDGTKLAYAGERGDLRVRDLASGRTITAATTNGEIGSIAWAPDGSRIAFTARERPKSD